MELIQCEVFEVATVDDDGTTIAVQINTIAGGIKDSMIIKSDGTVHGTGDNAYGQLGDNTTTDRHVFTASNGTTASSIACGSGIFNDHKIRWYCTRNRD